MQILKGLRRPPRPTKEEYLAKLLERNLDGAAVKVDPVPLAPPIGYKKQPSMVELVRDMVRGERLKAEAEAAGYESFEDAEDFEVGDEAEYPSSPHENDHDPPLSDLLKAGQAVQTEKARKEAAAKKTAPAPAKAENAPPAKPGEAPQPTPEASEDP